MRRLACIVCPPLAVAMVRKKIPDVAMTAFLWLMALYFLLLLLSQPVEDPVAAALISAFVYLIPVTVAWRIVDDEEEWDRVTVDLTTAVPIPTIGVPAVGQPPPCSPFPEN